MNDVWSEAALRQLQSLMSSDQLVLWSQMTQGETTPYRCRAASHILTYYGAYVGVLGAQRAFNPGGSGSTPDAPTINELVPED